MIERPEQRRRRRKGYGGQLGRVHAGQIFKVTSLEGHAGGGAAVFHSLRCHGGNDGGGKADVSRKERLALSTAGHIADRFGRRRTGNIGQRADGLAPAGAAGKEPSIRVGRRQQGSRLTGGAVQIQPAVDGNIQQLNVEAVGPGATHDILVGLPESGRVQGSTAGGCSDGDIRRTGGIGEEDVYDALPVGVAACAAGAVAGEFQGDIAGLLHADAGHEDRVINGVLPAHGLHIQLVVQPEGVRPEGGLVFRIQRAVHGAGQLVKADVFQLAVGTDILPERLEILGGQCQRLIPGRDVQHVHIPGVLLHRDGQHTGVALAVGVVGGKADNEVAGSPLGSKAHIIQILGGFTESILGVCAGDIQLAHAAAAHVVKAHIIRPGAAAAQVLDRVIDLAGNGVGGPAVLVPQVQLAVLAGDDGACGDEFIHLDDDTAGLGQGHPGDGSLGLGVDHQDEIISTLFPIDGGGQPVLFRVAYLPSALAVVIPEIAQLVIVGDIGAAQGQADIACGQLGRGVAQGNGHCLLRRQVHRDGAVVGRAALLTDAVGKAVRLRPFRLLGVFAAHAGVGAVAVVGVKHVVISIVDLGLLQRRILTWTWTIFVKACIFDNARLVAVGLMEDRLLTS